MGEEGLRIHVDLGHPAHVHFFRHPIAAWRERGHRVSVTARDKDMTLELLEHFGIPHRVLSRAGEGRLRLLGEAAHRVPRLALALRRERADVVTAVGGAFVVPAGRLARTPAVVFTDSEHVGLERRWLDPLAERVVTPEWFELSVRGRHETYRGLHELAYLDPRRFRADPAALAEVGLAPGEAFTVLRLVSWGAGHDAGQRGFRPATVRRLAAELPRFGRLLASIEGECPPELEAHRIRLPAHRIHDLLAHARLYLGEGATMATEAALLATPSIYVSSLVGTMGNFEQLAARGLVESFRDGEAALERALELLSGRDGDPRQDLRRRRDALVESSMDVAQLVADIVEAPVRAGSDGEA